MQIPCVHCSGLLQVDAGQFGQTIPCPHCGRPIALPAAEEQSAEPHRGAWLSNSISTLASVVFHTALVLILALISYGDAGVFGEGEEVAIGQLPAEQLEEGDAGELALEPAEEPVSNSEQLQMALEIEPPSAVEEGGSQPLDFSPPSAGGSGGEFDLGAVGIGSSTAGGGDWGQMLQDLRQNGLDVVIAFDSTSSMTGEINQVKSQIQRIGNTLLRLVPKARVGLCTYRDTTDSYVARGMPLTSDVAALRKFLYGVTAAGGGDSPEAVDRGLQWSMTNNDFRSRARKVILLFGDAPPHRQKLADCLRLASDFNRQQEGIVSTVTCRRGSRLPEFVEIAKAGGGEAFLTTDERQIMTQLVVLVFGARHREKVLEAFDLLDR